MTFSPEIVASTITTLGAFILVYLSVVKDDHVSKSKIIREQLEKFSIPFYKIYCRGFLSELTLSEMSLETWSLFLDLMSDNLHLMEPASQSMYSKYYSAYLTALEAKDRNPMFSLERSMQALDETFAMLCTAVFAEYITLLRKAKLPVPILPKPKRNDC